MSDNKTTKKTSRFRPERGQMDYALHMRLHLSDPLKEAKDNASEIRRAIELLTELHLLVLDNLDDDVVKKFIDDKNPDWYVERYRDLEEKLLDVEAEIAAIQMVRQTRSELASFHKKCLEEDEAIIARHQSATKRTKVDDK